MDGGHAPSALGGPRRRVGLRSASFGWPGVAGYIDGARGGSAWDTDTPVDYRPFQWEQVGPIDVGITFAGITSRDLARVGDHPVA